MKRVWKIVTGAFIAIHWLALAAIAIFIVFIVNDYVTKYWSGWSDFKIGLYYWSTLITGLLALGAAWLTVKQMQITDKQQQLRHDDLMRLNVRSDALIVERAVVPHMHYLREEIDHADALFRHEEFSKRPTKKYVDEVAGCLDKIVAIIGSEDIHNAKKLFGTRLHQDLRRVTSETGALSRESARLSGLIKTDDPIDYVVESEMWPAQVADAKTAFNNIKTRCLVIADDLDDLFNSYRR